MAKSDHVPVLAVLTIPVVNAIPIKPLAPPSTKGWEFKSDVAKSIFAAEMTRATLNDTTLDCLEQNLGDLVMEIDCTIAAPRCRKFHRSGNDMIKEMPFIIRSTSDDEQKKAVQTVRAATSIGSKEFKPNLDHRSCQFS